MKAKVILNPITGRGQGARLLPKVEAELRRHGIKYELCITSGPGHALQIAREVVPAEFDCVIAVGGDGTVNEVVNGLIAAAQASNRWQNGDPVGTLGVIPIGSGNDFAFALGLRAHDIAYACKRIAIGQPRLVDVAHVVDDRPVELYFCNNMGSGFDAAVNIEAHKLKRVRGFLLYFVALIRTIFLYYRAPWTEITAGEDQLRMPILMASIANGPRTGGGFLMAPKAQVDDGVLDLCVAGQVSRLGILRLIPHFLRGTHEGQRPIQMLRANHIVIETKEGLPVHVDGEVFRVSAHRLDVHIWQQRLRVLA